MHRLWAVHASSSAATCSTLRLTSVEAAKPLSPALTCVAFGGARRCYAANPNEYRVAAAYDAPTMKYFAEGHDVDFKEDVRAKLKEISQQRQKGLGSKHWSLNPQQAMQQLRLLASNNLLSFAEIVSTPSHFLSFYEVLATYDTNLAIVAAEHFAFATLVAKLGRSESRRHILEEVDWLRTVGTTAWRDLSADGSPFCTEAQYSITNKTVTFRGQGKFAVVASGSADYAIISADLLTSGSKPVSMGPKVFLVQLRDKSGKCLPGITIHPIDETTAHSGLDLGIVHFQEHVVSRDSLLLPFTIGDDGTVEGGGKFQPLDGITTTRHLAEGAVGIGLAKRLLSELVAFVSRRKVVGPTGRREHFLFGLQHIQVRVVDLVCAMYMCIAGWHRCQTFMCNPTYTPNTEEKLQFESTVFSIRKLVRDIHEVMNDVLGPHTAFASSGVAEASSYLAWSSYECDLADRLKSIAKECALKKVGASHAGLRVTSPMGAMNLITRFMRNPFFSPRSSEMARHLIFHSHRYLQLRRALLTSRNAEEKRGPEHVWYDWNTIRYRELMDCGNAFIDMYLIETMMDETSRCLDIRGRKVLRDLNRTYSLSRMEQGLPQLVLTGMIPQRQMKLVHEQHDHISTAMASQCFCLVESLQVPKEFLSPVGYQMETHYTIPGTSSYVSHSTDVTAAAMDDQDGEIDLLHGLDKEDKQ